MQRYASLLLIGAALRVAGCASSAQPPGEPASQPASQPASRPASQPGHHGEHAMHGGHAHHGEGKGDHFAHRFEDAEQWAKRFDDPARDAWQKPAEVVEHLDLNGEQVVADIGAGTGYFLPHLSPKAKRVLALDIEESMVAYMKARAEREGLANVEARVVPGDGPGLDAQSVDRVLIVDTWHHIPSRIEYTKKLAAALEPGGFVMIVDFTKDSPEGPPPKHRIPPEKVSETLAAGGLIPEIIEESLPRQYIVIGRKPAG